MSDPQAEAPRSLRARLIALGTLLDADSTTDVVCAYLQERYEALLKRAVDSTLPMTSRTMHIVRADEVARLRDWIGNDHVER